MDFDLKLQQSDMEATRKYAFTKVCAIVDNKLIKEGGITKLSDQREIYDARLEKTPFVSPIDESWTFVITRDCVPVILWYFQDVFMYLWEPFYINMGGIAV